MESVHKLLRTENHALQDLYCIMTTSDANTAVATAKVKLLHLLILLMFMSMPAWEAKGEGVPDQDYRALRGLEELLSAEMSSEHRGTAPLDFSILTDGGVTPTPGSSAAWHFPVSPEWLSIHSPLVEVGREYALQLGLRKLHEQVGGLPLSQAMKELRVLEEFVMGYFQDCLSMLIGELKEQVDAACALRTKLYGLVGTFVIFMSKFLMSMYILGEAL